MISTKNSKFTIPRMTREEILADDPLKQYFVWWDDITEEQISIFINRLNSAMNESDMQQFLNKNPIFLIQHLGGGHGRWVIPQKKLGSEFITDFLIGERHSGGYHWIAVELESPKAKIFNKNGDPSHTLNHSIRQILDWRSWLIKNQNYAARERCNNGMGLVDIDPQIDGLIIIGRENNLSSSDKELRKQISLDLRIKIHTYDWLARMASGRYEALISSGEQ